MLNRKFFFNGLRKCRASRIIERNDIDDKKINFDEHFDVIAFFLGRFSQLFHQRLFSVNYR